MGRDAISWNFLLVTSAIETFRGKETVVEVLAHMTAASATVLL
jgi:hypothetical protein